MSPEKFVSLLPSSAQQAVRYSASRNKMAKKGFTLIELLVTLSIFGAVVLIGSSMFFSILKGSAKSRVMQEVKQNGDYAVAVMERMVRNSRQIIVNSDGQICVGGMAKIKIKNPDGGTSEFGCLAIPGQEEAQIASNAASLTNSRVKWTQCSFDCSTDARGRPVDVIISFTLAQVGGERVEEKASATFRTAVTLRNP